MQVTNCTLYADNPYQKLLYKPLTGRYEPKRGTVDDAVAALADGKGSVLHIHWEEHIIRASRTAAEARGNVQYFLKRLAEYAAAGGRILWTIHNELPHELQHPEIFLYLRSQLCAVADVIIVHNTTAINVLARQAAFDRRKVYLLAHPSYLGHYEDAEVTMAAPLAPHARTVLAFGMMRRYKGFNDLAELLPAEFMAEQSARLKFAGAPVTGDPYPEELRGFFAGRDDVDFDFRNIPEAEVPDMFRSCAAIVLPYNRFLTSGVALLAVSFGVPVVAPATDPLREVVPISSQALLFDPSSKADFQRAIDLALNMEDDQRQAMRKDLLARAYYLRPERIGKEFGKLVDHITQAAEKYGT